LNIKRVNEISKIKEWKEYKDTIIHNDLDQVSNIDNLTIIKGDDKSHFFLLIEPEDSYYGHGYPVPMIPLYNS